MRFDSRTARCGCSASIRSLQRQGALGRRLGPMIAVGQPKATAEYIQATNRLGRDLKGPGLVVTIYNWARPRNLSHYEAFAQYHATFYRHVEALSVTPFAARALDRRRSRRCEASRHTSGRSSNGPRARGCTPETCGFRDHHKDLAKLHAEVFGISVQDTPYQQEMVKRLEVPFEVLSDEHFAFIKALRLPTFAVDGMTLNTRLTLIASNGHIEQVFYPVFPPDKHAVEVIAWLKQHPV